MKPSNHRKLQIYTKKSEILAGKLDFFFYTCYYKVLYIKDLMLLKLFLQKSRGILEKAELKEYSPVLLCGYRKSRTEDRLKEFIMAASFGQIDCKLYPSVFSGEIVFQVDTSTQGSYEGVAPKHYVSFKNKPTKDGTEGQVKVRVLNNGENEARVSVPDGQILTVPADKVHQL